MTRNSKESVLSRWSRRKLEAEQPLPTESMPAEIGATQPEALVETGPKPVLTDADMPDIASLSEDSDFSGFMSSGVSDELRNLALRKLFRAPLFNIRDGLDEYDEDYTTFEKLGDIVTSDMKHHIEMQEQKLREKLAAESEAAEAESDALEAIEDEEEPEQPSEVVASAEIDTGTKQDSYNEQ